MPPARRTLRGGVTHDRHCGAAIHLLQTLAEPACSGDGARASRGNCSIRLGQARSGGLDGRHYASSPEELARKLAEMWYYRQ